MKLKIILITILTYTSISIVPHVYAQTANQSNLSTTIASITSTIITLNNPVKIAQPKRSFNRNELPKYLITIPDKDPSNIGIVNQDKWTAGNEELSATIFSRIDNKNLKTDIKKINPGEFEVTINNIQDLKPGSYDLNATAKESFIYTRNLYQDFSWGVLAFNTNKSIYLPNETAKLGFGVVDERGHTVCYAKIWIEIKEPGNKITQISTENGTIQKSSQCRGDSFTTIPDYFADYKVSGAGFYQMTVTAENLNGKHTTEDYFEVRNAVEFDIERVNFPTRVYPRNAYDVQLKIKANKDYKGQIKEIVPTSFGIRNISNNGVSSNRQLSATSSAEWVKLYEDLYDKMTQIATPSGQLVTSNNQSIVYEDLVAPDKNDSEIVWNVDLKNGDSITLSYTIDFPLKSPEFYLAGPLSIDNFAEIRQWQIAIDAAVCWDGGGANENWSTIENWASDTAPTATDVATFGSPACTSGTPNKNATLDASMVQVNGNGGGIDIQSGYSGTLTQSTNLTIGSGDFVIAGGTFTKTTQTITTAAAGDCGDIIIRGGTFNSGTTGAITIGAPDTRAAKVCDYIQTGGTFNAQTTSGNINVSSDFIVLGGTFDPKSGTVNMAGNTAVSTNTLQLSISGIVTLNNLTFTGVSNSVGIATVFNVTSGSTVTVTGTLTFTEANNATDFINGPGQIIAQGNIVTSQAGIRGGVLITINGTGDQTITGTTGTAGACIGSGNIPSIAVNKPSGTLTINNKIVVGDWIHVNGTIVNNTTDFGFANKTGSGSNATSTNILIKGNTGTLSNVYFYGPCNNPFSTTITIDNNTTLNVTGNLKAIDSAGGSSSVINGPGNINFSGATLDWGISGSTTHNVFAGTAELTFIGGSNQTVNIHNTANNRFLTGTIRVNKSGGEVTYLNNISHNNTGQDYFIDSGTLSLAGKNLTINDIFAIGPNGTLKLQGAETFSTIDSNQGTIMFTGDNDATADNYTITGISTIPNFVNLTIDGAETGVNVDSFRLGANQTITGDFTLTDGTFDTSNDSGVSIYNLTVGRNFSNNGGTFTQRTSTVTLNTTNTATIAGSTTFYNLSCTTAGKNIIFTAGTTQTISNALTLTGSAGSPISLSSTSSGSAWNIDAPNPTTVTYVVVKDSVSDPSGATKTITATTSNDSGGNTRWTFSGSSVNSGNFVILYGGSQLQGGSTIQSQ